MSPLQSIDGLASGLNTTEIIDSIMQYERRPAVLMEREQEQRTKEITTFNALTAKLIKLQTSIDALNSERSFNQASLKISNEDLLSATAEGRVESGSYSLNILALAANHQIASHGFNDPTQAVMGTGNITLALGEDSATTLTIDAENNSLSGIKDAINEADIGITASIINDGSSSKPYRLVLTGNETGRANRISFESSLSNGLDLDFDSVAFDDPETVEFSAEATSQVSLGASAAFTGSTNKTYEFTVAGNGAQTVGAGNITIDWTDGENSGSIVVSQADTEVVGPDGLKLTFGGGDLVGGDTFQVSTFAPTLQKASDAQISFGNNTGGASPLIVNSETNEIEDLIPGVTINLKGLTSEATGPVTIETGLDTGAVKKKIQSFVEAFNEVKSFLDDQNSFNPDTEEGGVLLGDLTLMTIQSRLSRLISEPVRGLESNLNTLASIGIRTGLSGRLSIRDSGRLSEALEQNLDDVLRLFCDGGTSDHDGISFVSTSTEVEGGSEFEVDVTQAATHGYLQGSVLTDPAQSNITINENNNNVKLRIDGIVSDNIVLSSRTYTSGADLAGELQTRINADDKIGQLGVSVEWVDLGNEGYLKLTSNTYGSSSKVETISSVTNSAHAALGLIGGGVVHYGRDVAATINGEKATGKGQILTGDEGNQNTAGLKLRITLTQSQVEAGAEGSISVTRGFASAMEEALDLITKSEEGVIARKTRALQSQVDNIKEQVEDFDERLALRRERLVKQWAELEMLMSELQSEESFLSSQLSQLSSNWNQILGDN